MNQTIGEEIELGSLAVELGILTNEDLRNAISLWLEETSQSLTDILEQVCGVDADELELVRALKSARWKPDSTVSVGNDESRQTNPRDFGGLPHSCDLSEGDLTRFERGRLFAKGGLGVLYEGHDRELNRTVAIKELSEPRLVDPWALERFARESEITASLEHPSIVPVHGRGVRTDGTPFYAMRMIQGITLREAADNYHSEQIGDATLNRLAFRKLIGHLIPVGQAIAYAHSNNIIHRDLKPSNVIIGEHGETMLIDWGLARRIGETESEPDLETFDQGTEFELTAQGTALGTLAYMSPEQARGDASIDQSTDIFGLGAILFYVLTGTPPRRSETSSTMISMARNGKFDEEELLRASVPRQLAAVCRQAMSLDPKNRYPTAAHFVNELESYLADEPVVAFPDSFPQRVRRWMRTHQAIAAGGLSTLWISIVAMGISLGVLSSKNESLRQANIREQASSLKAMESADIAKRNGEEALRQRQRVLGILKTFLVDVERGLGNVPGSAAVQQNVLNTVLQKLGEVSSEFASDGEFRQSNAIALMELGDLFSRVGTKGILLVLPNRDLAALTPLEAADAVYMEAIKMAEQSASEGTTDSREMIATIQQKRGEILSQTSRTPEATELFELSLATRRLLLVETPQSVEAARDVASSLDSLGKIYLRNNDTTKALQSYEEIVLLLSPLAQAFADNTEIKRSLGIAQSRLGDIAIRNGETERASEYYEADLVIAKELFDNRPNDLITKRDLCISLDRIGNVAVQKGELERAVDLFQQSRQYREELRNAEPTSLKVIHELFVSNMKCGDIRMMQSDVSSAQSDYRQSLELADEMARLDPGNTNARRFQSLAAEVLGDVALQQNQFDVALQYAQRSFVISQELASTDPTDGEKQRDLALGHLKMSQILMSLTRYAESLVELNSALHIKQAAFDQNPSSLQSVNDLSVVHLRIAQVQMETKEFAKAKENCGKVIALFETVPEANRQDAITRRRIVNALTLLGRSQIQLGEIAVARSNLTNALRLATTMIEEGVRAEQMQLDAIEIESLLASAEQQNEQ